MKNNFRNLSTRIERETSANNRTLEETSSSELHTTRQLNATHSIDDYCMTSCNDEIEHSIGSHRSFVFSSLILLSQDFPGFTTLCFSSLHVLRSYILTHRLSRSLSLCYFWAINLSLRLTCESLTSPSWTFAQLESHEIVFSASQLPTHLAVQLWLTDRAE